MSLLWHNGQWKKDTEALLQFQDRLRYGDGIFDTLLIVDSIPINAAHHFERLSQGAEIFAMDMPFEYAAFEKILSEIIHKNDWLGGQVVLNTVITRGPGKRGLNIPEAPDIQTMIRGAALPEMSVSPAKLIIAKSVRRNEHSPLSRIKSCNYGENILARIEADKKGADDAVMLNTAGFVTCATSSNIFIVDEAGAIKTPPLSAGVLDGTLRRKFIEIYNVQEINITEEELLAAKDIILTNSVLGIRRAASLNGATLSGSDLEFDNTLHLQ